MREALLQFHLIRPLWLLLVVPIVIIWWKWLRSADPLRGWKEQMDPTLLQAVTIGQNGGNHWRSITLLVCWLLAALVVAGPTWRAEPDPFADDLSPLVIVLKSDAKMGNRDVSPSHLERARLKVVDLANTRKGQPLGLIAYAGSAHLVLPPTKDTSVVGQMAGEISSEIMPLPGDHLEKALATAGDLLRREQSSGSILIIADTVEGDLNLIAQTHRKQGAPQVEFLAINEPGSSEDQALREAARVLNAEVHPVTTDGSDLAKIVRATAHPPASHDGRGQRGVRWQEGGWYLLPILAGAAAWRFRREANGRENVS